ncbi:hypothetical protein [Metabacillus fastidiosus]|uniref:hypothetical protein n=1 Tax=Metabacillus fastidiosus TaxID=1458 RepID=UPI002E1E556D|nr:hypothetical protein [Metabacillus fastidiosus]
MSKKKIAKFGLTAAVAATTVVAATPADAASVSATEKAVKQAAQSAGALVKYYSSTDIKVSGEFVTANNNARKAIANAKAALAKYNGKDKAQHEATVAKAEGQQLDAARYIDAEKLVKGELVNAAKAVDAHVKAQTLGAETVTAYNKLSDTIKKAERVIGKVRGEQVRKAFGDKFLQDAKLTREALIYEVSQYQLLNKIAEKVAKDDFNGLDAELAKLDRLKDRAVAIKEAGRKLYPGRTDVYPELPKIEDQLRSKETELRDKITKASPLPAVASVKAINATTVEVAFKEAVKDIASVRFAIEGLEVKNAAVKQTDNKTVVITTSTQEGAKDYTLKNGGFTLGKFKGVSAVIPSDIKVTTTSVQGVVGKEVTLKANIDKKEAGVPVTFNVDADNNSLNKDIVAEVYTDANGVATFTYTQYNGVAIDHPDYVAVYATGNASKRDFAKVYWGVEPILTIQDGDDKKGTSLTNGDKKVYKVVYKDSRNGKGLADKTVNVTFAENVGVTSDKLSTATIEDANGNKLTPYQLSNGNTKAVTVKTDKDGVATFTVSGTNTKVTPIVFADVTAEGGNNNDKLDATELQASAPQVTFGGAQVNNTIEIKAEGSDHVAVGPNNGRVYTVTVKDKDGKAYAGGIVNLALNENLDKDIATNTKASFAKKLDKDGKEEIGKLLTGKKEAQNQLELDKNGQAKFVLVSDTDRDYGTPIIWIDQNVAENYQDGVLENGEPSKIAERTFFELEAVKASELKVYKDGKEFEKVFAGNETAVFTYNALNQSGKVVSSVNKEVTFEVVNNGSSTITVKSPGNTDKEVAGYGRTTIKVTGTNSTVEVTSKNGEDAKVTVSASGYQVVPGQQSKYLGNQTATATFSKYANAEVATGIVSGVNTTDKTFTVTDAKGKTFFYKYKDGVFQEKGNKISEAEFEALIQKANPRVTVTQDSAGKYTFNVLEAGTTTPTVPGDTSKVVSATIDTANTLDVTFTNNVTLGTPINLNQYALDINNNGTIDAGETATGATVAGNVLTLTFGAIPTSTLAVGEFVYNPGTVAAEYLKVDSVAVSSAFKKAVNVAFANTVTTTVNNAVTPGAKAATLSSKATVVSASGITTGGNVAVTVTATGLTGTPLTLNVPVELNDNAATVASKVRSALSGNAAIQAKFTVSGAGEDVILTSKTATTAANVTDTLTIGLVNGTATGLGATTVVDTVGAVGAKAQSSIKVDTGAAANGSLKPVTVRVQQTGLTSIDRLVEVAVAKGDTVDQVATKIAQKLQSDSVIGANFTVTATGDTVTLTNKVEGTVTTTITVTP